MNPTAMCQAFQHLGCTNQAAQAIVDQQGIEKNIKLVAYWLHYQRECLGRDKSRTSWLQMFDQSTC